MSILIKNMEMPTEGYIDVRIKCNGTASFAIADNPYFKAVEAVSLPPHGRPVARGKWISQRDGKTVVKLMYGEPIDSCFCSVCHEWLVSSDEYDVKGNFCPNCGADMRP